MKAYIYAIKNIINNKIYIGSSKSINKRRYEHFYLLKYNKHHSKHLQNSYNNNGKHNFLFYIIEECIIENRKERELYYINLYKAFNRDFGYNIQEPNENKFKCSEETKEKMSNSTGHLKKKVDVYELNGIFINTYESISECSKKLNIPSGIISRIVNKKIKCYKNLFFVRSGESFSYIKSPKSRDMSKFYK